uniref:GCFC domain-containing protein n=1 Tax=Steinernema glaseri TaxID=37863 RepID=A0A1I8AUR6_9BILA
MFSNFSPKSLNKVSLINLGIFITLRVLLDSENEFDEPILQGELRERVTVFLGIFSLSFCFGCCCCFCCGGSCLKWLFACSCSCLDISTLWESTIKRPTLLKSKLRSDDNAIEDMIMQKQEEHLQRKLGALDTPLAHKPAYTNEAFENTTPEDSSEPAISFAAVHRSRETRIDFSMPRVAPSKGERLRSHSFGEFTDIPV